MTDPTAPRKKLSVLTKLAYGAGDTGPAIVAAINGFFLLDFLINVAGLRPGTAGNIFLIAKIWDAVNDPVVGWLTDKTVSRMGRRRPWLLFGALPFGLAFLLHWIVPALDEGGKFWYYLLVAILLDTAITAVNVPYVALTPELTPDYDERTNLSSYRFGFSILGGVLAAFFHTQIVTAFGGAKALGNTVSIAIWAVVSILGFLATFFGTREPAYATRPAAQQPEGPGLLAGLRIAFQNRPFVLVVLIYMLSWLTLQFVQTNLFIYARDWVGVDDSLFGFVLLALQFSSFVFMLIWARISERLGKKTVYYLGTTILMIVLLGMFFIQRGQTTLFFGAAVLAGVGVAVCYLIPWSMLPDVIEWDELQTGQRREGLFAGFFVFLQKLGLSLGLFVSGWVLDLAGYLPAQPGQAVPAQPESVLLALRILVGPAGAAILALSFVAAYYYPITREKHAEIRAQLKARNLPE
ncbi:MAG: MFS transporter [Anaerolineales bacterium]|nr:MFS transporter [Anaerolineales bacterium]